MILPSQPLKYWDYRRVPPSLAQIQDLNLGRWALNTKQPPAIVSSCSWEEDAWLQLLPGSQGAVSCSVAGVTTTVSPLSSLSRFSALSYLTLPWERPGCRRSRSKSHSIPGTAWHHVTSDVYLNVYSLTWINMSNSAGSFAVGF